MTITIGFWVFPVICFAIAGVSLFTISSEDSDYGMEGVCNLIVAIAAVCLGIGLIIGRAI